MKALRVIIPHPIMALSVFLLWLALAQAITVGQVLLGLLVALTIPKVTERFWPGRPRLARPWTGFRLMMIVIFDILTANIAVARLVIGPLDRLRPSFVEVPLNLRDEFVATILGSIVSLTPGTVSIEIDCKRWVLLVHALDVEDEQALVQSIKSRYEAPLRETFAC